MYICNLDEITIINATKTYADNKVVNNSANNMAVVTRITTTLTTWIHTSQYCVYGKRDQQQKKNWPLNLPNWNSVDYRLREILRMVNETRIGDLAKLKYW